MVNVNNIEVTADVLSLLKEVASLKQVSVEQLADYVLTKYAAEELLEPPDPEEIAAVKASIEEANQPGARTYTTDEVVAEILAMLDGEDTEEEDEDDDKYLVHPSQVARVS